MANAGIKKIVPIQQLSKHNFLILTYRETEYLSLVALGNKNKKIAEYLCVSTCTVKKTLEKIFEKLSAKDRSNAVAIALIHNIINAEMLLNIKNRYDVV